MAGSRHRALFPTVDASLLAELSLWSYNAVCVAATAKWPNGGITLAQCREGRYIVNEEGTMDKIIRRQFLGNWVVFWLLCVTILGIPVAILYLIDGMVTIEQQVEDATAVMEIYRQR